MEMVEITTNKGKVVGKVIWGDDSEILLEIFDPAYNAGLKMLLQQMVTDGVPYRSNEIQQYDDEEVIVERRINVKSDDNRFLVAVADAIRNYQLDGQRLFGFYRDQS